MPLAVQLLGACAAEPPDVVTADPIPGAAAPRRLPTPPADGPTEKRADGTQVTLLWASSDPERAVPGGVVTLDFEARTLDGTLASGALWDTTYSRARPQRFVLGRGRLVKGLDESLIGARPGERMRVTVPAASGFGAQGAPGRVGPDTALVFDVSVIDVAAPPAARPPPTSPPFAPNGLTLAEVATGGGAEVTDGARVTFDVATFVGGLLRSTTAARREPVSVTFREPGQVIGPLPGAPLRYGPAFRGMRAGSIRQVHLPDDTVVELSVLEVVPSGDPGQ
jgi:FKBP-type peptidyl-prolyl cis-trans isomerase